MPEQYSNIVLEGLGFVDGQENTSGIQEDAYLLLYDDIATFGSPTPGTTPESLVEISSNHVMKTGKSPIPLYTLYEKSGMDATLTGEMFSKIFISIVKLHLPQPNEKNAVNFSVIKNRRFIVLIKRAGGTDFIQIGSQGLYAKVKDGSVKFGDGPTGTPGVDFQVEAPSIHPYYVYKGTLPVVGV